MNFIGLRGSVASRIEKIETLISKATALAESGELAEGIRLFKDVRAKLVASDPQSVEMAIAKEAAALDKESLNFESWAKTRSSNKPNRKAVLISDSLGLPRVVARSESDATTFEMTCAGLVLDALSKTGDALVQPLCRRYGTTEFVLQALQNRADCQGSDVLIHIGLNDCVVRMFKENQRLALSTLDKALCQKIVGFSNKYRTPIIESDFEHTYTPLTVFKSRLVKATRLARSNGAKSVTFATIIQPPVKFAAKTPHMSWNFNRYNMAVYDAAKNERCHLIDMDRLCWEHGTQKSLSLDGMHLSAVGHAIMAEHFLNLTKP